VVNPKLGITQATRKLEASTGEQHSGLHPSPPAQTMKPIRIKPLQLPALPNAMGRPTATNPLDRRYANGWGRTFAQQMADQQKRRYL